MNVQHLLAQQQQPCLCSAQETLSGPQVNQRIEHISQWLRQQRIRTLALALDNSVDWVLWDLACQQVQCLSVPVPDFFSPSQQAHLLQQSGAQLWVTSAQQNTNSGADSAANLDTAWQSIDSPFAGIHLWYNPEPAEAEIPRNTGKITFTSGSTGQPKGVCLSSEHQWCVAESLRQAIAIKHPKHLCLLPLATLLENVAGIYAPLLAKGSVYLASEQERGFQGSRLVHPQKLLSLITTVEPNTLILVPELLRFLLQACETGWQPPSSLQFIAVGGSKVSRSLLLAASAAGLPVYQGYGLSECGSVVTLNTPTQNLTGSAGVPLPHVNVQIQEEELIVTGQLFLGYVNQPDSFYPKQVATGDVAHRSQEHYFIDGRFKNLFINSYGRNFSPEWIEAEFQDLPAIRHCVVIGDDLPYCSALIEADATVPDSAIDALIQAKNQSLPDYGQIKAWYRLPKPLAQYPGLLTGNGKLQRQAITARLQMPIAELYAPVAKMAAKPAPQAMEV